MSGIWDTHKSIDHHRQITAGRRSSSDCARYVRKALEAGGIFLHVRPTAKDYKPSLLAAGFLPLGAAVGGYLPGDVIIIDPSPGHEHGHMAMYDGRNWVSDFKQKHMLHIYPDQSATEAMRLRYTIFRYGIRWDSIAPPLSSNLG